MLTDKILVLVINVDYFFLSHRLRIATEALGKGWEVRLLAKDTGHRKEIEAMGIKFVDIPVNPTGMNPLEELRLFRFLVGYYRSCPGAIVHHVGLKNIIWGGLAARISKVRGVVDAVCGLGTLFGQSSSGLTKGIVNSLISCSVRPGNTRVIFQNHDDQSLFMKRCQLGRENVAFIKGSGVDLDRLVAGTRLPGKKPVVIFTARMLREKGVFDLIDAAEMLRPRWEGKAEFWLCGDVYPGRSGLSRGEIASRCDGNYIKWLGQRGDIPSLLAKADIMAYPSYYREGVPKSLLEASAAGLPIVTTDSVGCRDTVEEGLNGFKVAPRSPEMLADRLETLLSDPEMRRNMGRASRRIAERDYDIRNVVSRHLDLYEQLHAAPVHNSVESRDSRRISLGTSLWHPAPRLNPNPD